MFVLLVTGTAIGKGMSDTRSSNYREISCKRHRHESKGLYIGGDWICARKSRSIQERTRYCFELVIEIRQKQQAIESDSDHCCRCS